MTAPWERGLPQDVAILAPLGGQRPPAPAWFDWAVAQRPESRFVTVDGVALETLTWGQLGAPGLLLLHGQAGNADWWSFLAPFLAETHRVTALSWSGMGASGWRDRYDYPIHSREAVAAAEACGLYASGRPPIMVGHSFGGAPLIHLAHVQPEALSGAVLVDCYFRLDEESPEAGPASGRHRVYDTLAEALARFRLQPPQPCENLYIADHIARTSLKQVEGGWSWRFDPAFRSKVVRRPLRQAFSGVGCPMVYMPGDRSDLVTPAFLRMVREAAPQDTAFVVIPDAAHHVMIDQPLSLVSALRTLLAAWPPARPIAPNKDLLNA